MLNYHDYLARLLSTRVAPGFEHLKQIIKEFRHRTEMCGGTGARIGLGKLHGLGDTLACVKIVGVLYGLNESLTDVFFHCSSSF